MFIIVFIKAKILEKNIFAILWKTKKSLQTSVINEYSKYRKDYSNALREKIRLYNIRCGKNLFFFLKSVLTCIEKIWEGHSLECEQLLILAGRLCEF